jgi:hypothetical protein
VRAPGQALQHRARLGLVGRLSEDLAVDVDLRVAGQDALALDGARLEQGVLEDDLARVTVCQLFDIRRADVELDPELLEDRLPLRRGASED